MRINFSDISVRSGFGRLLRLPLRLIPKDAIIPILQGPSRGMRWIVGSSDHGCWLGSYESHKSRVVAAMITPGSTVYDVGANVGYFTLLFSALVGDRGTVVAFEPLPANLRYLREHVRRNSLRNVRIVDAAVSDTVGEVRFAEGTTRAMGHIAESGTIATQAVTLDRLVQNGELAPPHCIKIDVEGAEAAVLRGAAWLLEHARPIVLVATHGEEVHQECLDILRRHGYRTAQLGPTPDELIATPD